MTVKGQKKSGANAEAWLGVGGRAAGAERPVN